MSTATTTADVNVGLSGNQTAATDQDDPMARLKSLFAGNSVLVAMVLGAATIAVAVALFMWASTPGYRVLFSNVSQADGGSIISELEKRSVPYRFSEGGTAILVPEDQVHLLRLQLAEQGLPNGAGVGFELMDNQAFGISQFAEQINFQRGLEGELVRSIKALGPVAEARIHLAMAKQSVFVRNREPAKASVLLTLHPGRVLEQGQVNAIMHLVSSSVAGLNVENISVVDQRGTLLSDRARGGYNQDMESSQLEHTQKLETIFRQRIESTLSPLFGIDNIHVQVTAQIDFSKKEETSERYAPNQDPSLAAVRSAQWSTDIGGGSGLEAGVPGALSNSPLAADVTTGDENPEQASTAQASSSGIHSVHRANTVNYEVDRNITHIQHQAARLQRLSSAVVVNYRTITDEEGNNTQQPLTEEELAQVTLLVKQAMGFSDGRGDQVEVVNSPFTIVEPEPEEIIPEPAFWETEHGLQMIITLARYLAAAIGLLVVYLLVLKPLLQRHLYSSLVATGEAQALMDETSEEDSEEVAAPSRSIKAPEYERSLDELRRVAGEDPRLVAMIVRSWMNKK